MDTSLGATGACVILSITLLFFGISLWKKEPVLSTVLVSGGEILAAIPAATVLWFAGEWQTSLLRLGLVLLWGGSVVVMLAALATIQSRLVQKYLAQASR